MYRKKYLNCDILTYITLETPFFTAIFPCINVFFRAKFGAEVGGGGGISSIFSIAKSQINKRNVTTKFEVNRNVKTDKKRKRKHKSKSDESGITLEDRKVKLDHRQTKFLYWILLNS